MGNIHKHLLKKPSTFYDTLIVRIQQKEPKCSEEKIYKKKNISGTPVMDFFCQNFVISLSKKDSNTDAFLLIFQKFSEQLFCWETRNCCFWIQRKLSKHMSHAESANTRTAS